MKTPRRSRSSITLQITLVFTIFSVILAALSSFSLYLVIAQDYTNNFRDKVGSIVVAAVPGLDLAQVNQVQTAADQDTAAYQGIKAYLKSVSASIPGADDDLYTMRQDDQGRVIFMVDASDDADTPKAGDAYDDATPTLKAAFTSKQPVTVEPDLYTDQYGTWLSAYAPIIGADGKVAGMLGLDFGASSLEAQKQKALQTVLVIFLISVPVGLLTGWVVGKKLSKPVLQLRDELAILAVGQIPDNLDGTIFSNQPGEFGEIGRSFLTLKQYIASMASTADAIASGDLTQTIAPHSDRDVLGHSFMNMVRGLKALVSAIGSNAQRLMDDSQSLLSFSQSASASTGIMLETAQTISSAAEAQLAMIERSADAMGHIDQSIGYIAAGSMDQAKTVISAADDTHTLSTVIETVTGLSTTQSGEIKRAANASRLGVKGTDEIIATMGGIRAKVSDTAQNATSISELAEKINQASDQIDDIAAQTNLLALNALIEAARAGEAGTGFSVVANEIRRLADRAAATASEIASFAHTASAVIQQVVESTRASTDEVEKGVSGAMNAGKTLREIQDMAQKNNSLAEAITARYAEIASASAGLLERMESISAVVEENSAMTGEIRDGIAAIDRSIIEIAGIAREYTQSTQQFKTTAGAVMREVGEVAEKSRQLAKMSDHLTDSISEFKI